MEYSSKNTSVNKNKVPALFTIVQKYYGWKKGATNLDLGGGKWDTATKYLRKLGLDNYILDPNRTEQQNMDVVLALAVAKKFHGGVETVTLSNVLNVVKALQLKLALLKTAKKLLKKDGVVYINVYEGDRSGRGKKSKEDCWQANKKLASYLPLVQAVFPKAVIEHGIIVARR